MPRIKEIHFQLGISQDYGQNPHIPKQPEAENLVPVDGDILGRPQSLEPVAAEQWIKMRDAAMGEGIELLVVSAFRSFGYQARLLEAKLAKGQSIEDILLTNAAPGFSQHHTGKAIDIAVTGCPPLVEEFETTEGFRWLGENAADFQFVMPYGRNNACGFIYEPWHWYMSG